ncbi:MAG TPA: hypothetical protein VNM41_09055, partial [Solirubrobacterales bacterium]|nr:hypothetical protein [Solirubrobacterales bacterium]
AVAWLCRRLPPAVAVTIVALLCLLSARQSSLYVHRLLTSHPVEVAAACGSFDGTILARKPHLGAICGQPWVFFPQVRSTEELQAWLQKHPVDYVAYGRPEAMSRRELLALADPRRAPPWLRPVFFSSRPRLVIYRVSAAPSAPGR